MSNTIPTSEEYFEKYKNEFDPYRVPTYVSWHYKNDRGEIIETKSILQSTMGDENIINNLKYYSNINEFMGFIDTPPFTD
jgi:hypothetical protein